MALLQVFLAVALLLRPAFAAASSGLARSFEEVFVEAKMRATDSVLGMDTLAKGPEADPTKFRFLQEATQQYRVAQLPGVKFDVGEMYSGLMPIDKNDPSRSLFFVFQPAISEPTDTLTIWMNGGPGCSSLEGFFQENGRFLWRVGDQAPSVNNHAWANLTNMLYVEYPIGTGFSIGSPKAINQETAAKEFLGFFKNFQLAFGIQKFKIYVTGESYAGRYVPYISAAMLDSKDKTYYDVQGALIYDGCIGAYETIQQQVVTVPYIRDNAAVLKLDKSFVDSLQPSHESCGYKNLLDKYLAFPPPGPMPPVGRKGYQCDIFSRVQRKMMTTNSCFDIYMINATCPKGLDVMKSSRIGKAYFDRPEVKTALHAPSNINWALCGRSRRVFVGQGGPQGRGDMSIDPAQKVLPQVIEATQRVIVANGNYDMIIITNGTLLAIQNMTFGGLQGFQKRPATPIRIENERGIQHFERGLLWTEAFKTGHMGPEWAPRLAYRHVEWMLKLRDTV